MERIDFDAFVSLFRSRFCGGYRNRTLFVMQCNCSDGEVKNMGKSALAEVLEEYDKFKVDYVHYLDHTTGVIYSASTIGDDAGLLSIRRLHEQARLAVPGIRSAGLVLPVSSAIEDAQIGLGRFSDSMEVLINRHCRVEFGTIDLEMAGVHEIDSPMAPSIARAEARRLWEVGNERDIEEAGFIWFESFTSSWERIQWVYRATNAIGEYSGIMDYHLNACKRICLSRSRWKFGKEVFEAIRTEVLALIEAKSGDGRTMALYGCLELVAKIVYNESCGPGSFDRDSGWFFLKVLRRFVGYYDVTVARGIENALFSAP